MSFSYDCQACTFVVPEFTYGLKIDGAMNDGAAGISGSTGELDGIFQRVGLLKAFRNSTIHLSTGTAEFILVLNEDNSGLGRI